MNDNNFRDIIGARLEEIHMAETMPETMPSEADILRWETLAKARTADRKRKMRRFISIAAVFLLAVVIGVAVIVGPPDAEAGGEGNAVIVENGGLVVSEYRSISDVPKSLKEKFVFINSQRYELQIDRIIYTKSKSAEQIEFIYSKNNLCEFTLTEIISCENTSLENDTSFFDRKEKWGGKTVFIKEDPRKEESLTCAFMRKNIYVNIYVNKGKIEMIKKIVEETF